ncbi:hypothetical protein OIU77_023630 [Salix suchowensis]|uniref:Uncharacterized protein n=1 Tax=Salix suchowensis TaxID=1278906 RepID=A0ABQ9C5E3_9ROSI|nr:hypothetical protein OIU77_023630 [Salix suchowensis]
MYIITTISHIFSSPFPVLLLPSISSEIFETPFAVLLSQYVVFSNHFISKYEQARRLELQVMPAPQFPEAGLLPTLWGPPGQPEILEVLVGGVARHSGSPGRMFVPVIGTALPETAAPTTLLAVLAASNVECSRKWTRPGALILIFLDLERLVGALEVVAIDLDGNPEIGFALGGDATSITLLAEWSASSAMPPEILAAELHIRYNFSISWDCTNQELRQHD